MENSQEGEDSIAFARRVKKAIAKAGGLVDLEWDGALKREKVWTEGRMKGSREPVIT